MITWNIRNQIMSAGLIGLLVIVAVIGYFYGFAKQEFRQHSRDLMALSNTQHADEINRTLAQQAATFESWTVEDVFGLAIEFNTTSELRDQFQRWLSGSDHFDLLALVDNSGKVVQVAVSNRLSGNPQRLTATMLPESRNLLGNRENSIAFVESPTLKDMGSKETYACAYYRPSYNSSNQCNGGVIGLTNWRPITSSVDNSAQAMARRGYSQALTALAWMGSADVVTSRAFASIQEKIELADQQLLAWSKSGQSGLVQTQQSDVGDILVAYGQVNPPGGDHFKAAGKDQPYLMTLIPEDQVMAALNRELVKMLVIGLLGTLVLMGASYWIARRISRRVARGSAIATAMAQGDIQQEINIDGNDEIGELGRSFSALSRYLNEMSEAAGRIANRDLTVTIEPKSERDVLGQSFQTMAANLSEIVQQLGASAKQLVEAAAMISDSSANISDGVRSQAEQITQVSSAVEQMTATIQESSQNAGQASQASQNASKSATAGGEIVTNTIQGMQKINEVVRSSAESIAELARSADQIGQIISVIDDIADQTNLLALNAAIEAARAGEQGRGFAVVADEVRKLAERTGKATGEISGMIKGIQQQTESAVGSMESGVQEVDRGRELVDTAGGSLKEIVTESQKVLDMIQQMATAAEEQAAAAEEISKTIGSISEGTDNTARGSEQSAEAARNLNQQAEELNQIVARFTVSS
mgnify:CR=1 FL=1